MFSNKNCGRFYLKKISAYELQNKPTIQNILLCRQRLHFGKLLHSYHLDLYIFILEMGLLNLGVLLLLNFVRISRVNVSKYHRPQKYYFCLFSHVQAFSCVCSLFNSCFLSDIMASNFF